MDSPARNVIAAIERALERHRRITEAWHNSHSMAAAKKAADASIRECDRRHYEYFEKVYYHEEKRRDEFTRNLSFLVGALAIAGAIGSFYLRDILEWMPGVPLWGDWTISSYVCLLSIAALCLGIASVFLILALYNYGYEYLATPSQIRKHYRELLAYHNDSVAAEVAFQEYLTDDYARAANVNDQNNITRRKYQHRCVTASIVLFAVLGLTFIPFCAHKMRQGEKQPLLIKWDNAKARVTLDQPVVFDKPWPSVKLSIFPVAVDAEEDTLPQPNSDDQTGETATTTTTATSPPNGANLLREKKEKVKRR